MKHYLKKLRDIIQMIQRLCFSFICFFVLLCVNHIFSLCFQFVTTIWYRENFMYQNRHHAYDTRPLPLLSVVPMYISSMSIAIFIISAFTRKIIFTHAYLMHHIQAFQLIDSDIRRKQQNELF